MGAGNGRNRKACLFCNSSIGSTRIKKLFNIKAVCPGHAKVFFCHQNPSRFLKVHIQKDKIQRSTRVLPWCFTFDGAALIGGWAQGRQAEKRGLVMPPTESPTRTGPQLPKPADAGAGRGMRQRASLAAKKPGILSEKCAAPVSWARGARQTSGG